MPVNRLYSITASRFILNTILFSLVIFIMAGCAVHEVKPVEEVLKNSFAKTRLTSPFTDDVGGVRVDGYQIVSILTYHAVKEKTRSKIHVTPEEFELQMDYLKENGYHVVSLKHFFEFINLERGLPEKAVVITFDDGWRSVYTNAYPILKKYGFPATMFIYTNFLFPGSKNALTLEMLKEMNENGIDIQTHSKTHDIKIPWRRDGESEEAFNKRLKDELFVPKEIIEKNLEKDVYYIAYPYGQYNEIMIKAARKYGYEGGLTVFGARVKKGTIVRKKGNPVFTEPFEVNRVQVLQGTSLKKFKRKLKAFQNVEIYDGRYDHLFEVEGL